MKKYTKSLPNGHQVFRLSPFDWRQIVVRPPTTRAGQYFKRRYRISPHIAEVIAALAGLGGGEQH